MSKGLAPEVSRMEEGVSEESLVHVVAADEDTPTVDLATLNISSKEFFWGRRQVLALISKVEEFYEDFYDASKKKKFVWQSVAERMQEEGFNCTGNECDKKWRNLKTTYVKVLQKQIHGETSSRFEYFDALHHILGNEIDPNGMRDQVLSSVASPPPKGWTNGKEYHEISVDEDFMWNHGAVTQMLDLLHHHHQVLTSPSASTTFHQTWQNVSVGMVEAGYKVDSAMCERKWTNLVECFHHHQAHAHAHATVPLWTYFTRVRNLLHLTEISNVVPTVNLSTVPTVKLSTVPTVKLGKVIKRGGGRRGRGNLQADLGVLGRVERLEDCTRLRSRLEHLEARVQTLHHQQSFKQTNAILTKILSELRRINTRLEQKATQSVIGAHEQLPQNYSHLESQDDSSCESDQGIIIVEAYAE